MPAGNRSRPWLASAVLAWSCLLRVAHADYPARTAIDTPKDIFAVSSLEELVVTGEREKLGAARKALIEADNHFYEVFNAGNDNHDYDMLCREETRTGTRISGRVCTPRIVEEGTQAEAARLQLAAGGSVMILDTDAIRAAAMVEMRKRVVERLKKDPDLLRALLERAKLQQHYEALRKGKFEGHRVSWD